MLGGRLLTYYVDSPDKIADASATARRGIKLWDLLLGLALAVALVRTLVGQPYQPAALCPAGNRR